MPRSVSPRRYYRQHVRHTQRTAACMYLTYPACGCAHQVFKEALGHMYKRKMVELGPLHVKLLESGSWESGIVAHNSEERKTVRREVKASTRSAALKARGDGASLKPKGEAKPKKKYARSKPVKEYRPQPHVPLPGSSLMDQPVGTTEWSPQAAEAARKEVRLCACV